MHAYYCTNDILIIHLRSYVYGPIGTHTAHICRRGGQQIVVQSSPYFAVSNMATKRIGMKMSMYGLHVQVSSSSRFLLINFCYFFVIFSHLVLKKTNCEQNLFVLTFSLKKYPRLSHLFVISNCILKSFQKRLIRCRHLYACRTYTTTTF